MSDTDADAEPDTAWRPRPFAPAPDGLGLAGFLGRLLSDPISAAPAACYHGPIAVRRRRDGRAVLAWITDPGTLDTLFRAPEAYPKSTTDARILRPAFGDSLLTAEGASWRWKRRLAAPFFAPAALAARHGAMIVPFREAADAWAAAPEGRIDVAGLMTRTTLEVVRRVLFAEDRIDVARLSAAIDAYLGPVPWVVALAALKAPDWAPFPGRGRMADGRRRMRALVAALVAGQRDRHGAGGEPGDSLTAALLAAEDPETGQRLTDDDLVDMALTLIAAGHETTAGTLTFALVALARQPMLEARLAAEIARVTGGAPVAPEHLDALVETEAMLREVLRLFPAGALMGRQMAEDGAVLGETLAAGTTLFVPVYALHRRPALWPDPDRFDIERHLGAERATIHRAAWMPFGAGPRICIGASFAMAEMVLGLATLVQRLAIAPAAVTPRIVHRVTLRPGGPVVLAARTR